VSLRLVVIFLRMLRYRVAAMVWLFMLLGAAHPDGLDASSPRLLAAALALAAAYVAATTVNDVADAAIDRVNHPRDSGRPLVTGEAEPRDLLFLHGAAWLLALAAAAPLGAAAAGLVLASLVVGVAYSVPPLTLSHRTWLAPLVLTVAYVAVPYTLGAVAAERELLAHDLALAAGLGALFLARIVLKDFRDRAGDLRYGRPTFLLRFGKSATCALSLAALVLGCVLLLVALGPPATLAALVVLLGTAVAWMLHWLWRAADPRLEQVAIGLGARLGNGLLLCVLGWLVLGGEEAAPAARTVFVALLGAVFLASSDALAARPAHATIGYKG
jgi:homogentisate phytyltransferase/homogentisate geranylgeranyltransferase